MPPIIARPHHGQCYLEKGGDREVESGQNRKSRVEGAGGLGLGHSLRAWHSPVVLHWW